MSRLAWFSPMPPVRSGVAAVSADLVRGLAAEHAIDVFVDEPVARANDAVRSAHDFVWMHRLAPYDLIVYQVGNSSGHDYLLPYLFRFPGLVVLHDVRLHHARAASLLRRGRAQAYREEFSWNHSDLSRDLAELAVAGFDSPLYYSWPMTRLIAQASRGVAVHTGAARAELSRDVPEAAIDQVRLGHGVSLDHQAADTARVRGRQRFGLSMDTLVFGCYGGLTPEKRVPQILDAFAATLRYAPDARLLLAGGSATHYDLQADIDRLGLAHRVIVTGYLAGDNELTEAIAACDVGLALRWPTAGEVSGPWLRCLALGKATVIIDLAHLAEAPALDPRTWAVRPGSGKAAAICVAIDLLDEDHSLRIAMRRLAADAELRAQLGQAGRDYWHTEHSPGAMLHDYRRVIAKALLARSPFPALPAHLTDDGTAKIETLLNGFGLRSPLTATDGIVDSRGAVSG